MQSDRASVTASFVAACRGFGGLLPRSARLALDPYGAAMSHPTIGRLSQLIAAMPPALQNAAWIPLFPALPWAVYMQVRTRVIDDALLEFFARGGRQVVILGAGFDVRAIRLRAQLGETQFFEVDHPATQARKRRVLEASDAVSPAQYVPWNFEDKSVADLPAALVALGLDPNRPTFTIWEGVTMYLTSDAIAATLRAIRGYSAPGSRVAFNYIDKKLVESPSPLARALGDVVSFIGEPFRSGFDPKTLATYLSEFGFAVETNQRFSEAAEALLPSQWSWLVRGSRYFAMIEHCAVLAG